MAGPPQPKNPRAPRARRRLRARPVVDVHLLTDDERAELDARDFRSQAVYDAGRAALARDRFRCAGRGLVSHACADALGVDPHHVIPRSVRLDLAAAVDNIVPVCRILHRWIDGNPDAARAVGLHGYSWDNLDALALLRRSRRFG